MTRFPVDHSLDAGRKFGNSLDAAGCWVLGAGRWVLGAGSLVASESWSPADTGNRIDKPQPGVPLFEVDLDQFWKSVSVVALNSKHESKLGRTGRIDRLSRELHLSALSLVCSKI